MLNDVTERKSSAAGRDPLRDTLGSAFGAPAPSLYEAPVDIPLGLDLSAFMPSETARSKFTNDLDLMRDVLKQHSTVVAVMTKRKQNLKGVERWWQQGNMDAAVNSLSMLKDVSVVMDLMNHTFAENEMVDMLTFENAAATLAHAGKLIESRYEPHLICGLRSLRNIFNLFSDRIM